MVLVDSDVDRTILKEICQYKKLFLAKLQLHVLGPIKQQSNLEQDENKNRNCDKCFCVFCPDVKEQAEK